MKPQKHLHSSKVDRLSEMPDQVIVHILSFTPTQDAVRTMLLRRFGNLWTMLPLLIFDFNDRYVRPGDDGEDDDDGDGDDDNDDDDNAYYAEKQIMSEAFSRFARFVRNMLMFHRSTIDCFQLDIGGYKGVHVDPWLIDDIQVWLKFATEREVKHLSFTCDYLDDLASPRCVFTSQSLVTLTLCGSMLELDGGLRNLNITTPSPSRLDLEVYDVPDRPFTLNCPHVISLDISIRGTSPSILLDVIDVSSLQVVNVRCLPICLSSLIIKAFLRHFRDVEVFTLSSLAFEELCCVKKVDIPQNKWRSLALQPWWDNERCLQVIIELVKTSVDLEELVLYSGKSSASEGNHEVLAQSYRLLV
ncbi:F-box/FBD/LRR-repeat protein At2g04230-like [Silene latifolia]|uniref:F-box/FBD/LRR-repeat protein At2g04230-like n=1 Tax=Silene latifolia TaxID=37657 RepID=UPI003D76CA2D